MTMMLKSQEAKVPKSNCLLIMVSTTPVTSTRRPESRQSITAPAAVIPLHVRKCKDYMMSPVSQGLAALCPQKSTSTILARRLNKPLAWESNDKQLSDTARNKAASELVAVLHALTKGNSCHAAEIIASLLKRKCHAAMRETVDEEIETDNQEVDTAIVSGITAFLNHHSTRGTRQSEE
jgi:hypothetical protein